MFNPVKAISDWWERHVFWHRFTHGVCTQCGKGEPLQGVTWCRACFERNFPTLASERAAFLAGQAREE